MRLCALLLPLPLLTACGGDALEPFETQTTHEALRHDVEYDVEDGIARLLVRRAVRGVATPELDLFIDLPTAASLDRFRFAINDRWYDGELLESTAAEDRYQLLSGLAHVEGYAVEGAPPPALLAYEQEGRLRLRAHPITPEDTVELEYRLQLPTCHAEGRALFDYPLDPSDPATFSGPGILREPLEEEDFSNACDADATVLAGERTVIELEPSPDLALTYAVMPMGARTAVRVAIDAPPELAPIPEQPSVVFVMDGSFSQGDAGLTDQLAWAKAYLAWVPDAQVEVVVFRREAERLFDRWVPGREFAAAVAAIPPERLALGNGSFLDRGLALAASILNGAGGEMRVVATSDLMMRNAFDAASTAESAGGSRQAPRDRSKGRGVLHLLARSDPSDGEPSLTIDTAHELAVLPHATGGLMAALSGAPTGDAAIAIAEELVHPIRLDEVQLIGLDDVTHEGSIDRGGYLRSTALLDTHPPDRIEIRGKLWSLESTFDVTRSSAVDAAMPAILVATARGLTDEELRDVAGAGGVVSSVTSYLAELGGVDPLPPNDLIGEGFGIGGFGMSGMSCGCGCRGWSGGVAINGQQLMDEVRRLAESCGAPQGEVAVETTRDEIADVTVHALVGEECLREAIWSLRLDSVYRDLDRTGFRFNL